MNRIKEARGNLVDLALEGHFNVIAHSCNCQNIMALGVAKEIRERLPQAEIADYRYWKENKACRNDMLGRFSTSRLLESQFGRYFVVANLYTQLTPGPAFKLSHLKWALESLFDTFGDVRYAIPKIGTELDGGNWKETKQLIYRVAEEYDLTIIHYD